MAGSKSKKKKVKNYFGVKEFFFNFFSLVFMISVGCYFGYRSLYYYSKQNKKIQAEAQTLNGTIIQNTVIAMGEDIGLHHDSLGYYFKGNVQNNYVLFGNRLFRIIRINEDNTVRLVSDDYVAIFPWGNDSEYINSNVYNWLDKTDVEKSGIFYSSLPQAAEFLTKTKFQIDEMTDGKMSPLGEEKENYISLLTGTDYVLAGGKNSYLNNGKLFFLLGVTDQKENLYVDTDASIQTCDSVEGNGIRPVFTLKANTIITGGDGTVGKPYTISQEGKTNYVYSYVKLGNDMWRVFYQDDSVLKLSYEGYASINGVECVEPYGQWTSYFDVMEGSNVGHYLNTTYLSTLPYESDLLLFNSYVGEISDDKGYQYSNIFTSEVGSKVGLLNIFDYIVNTSLEDYFRLNTTSEVGNMQYNTTANGRLLESDIKEAKHIVPVVCISIDKIKGGSGNSMDPYVIG